MARWHAIFSISDEVPLRWQRLLMHFLYPWNSKVFHLPSQGLFNWFLDLLFYILDVFFLPELYKALYVAFKPNIRKLNTKEIHIAHSVFYDLLDTEKIIIDEQSRRVSRKLGVAYVTFGLIHCWKSLNRDVFIHELVHVFQYQLFGSVYIAHALRAQMSHPSYDYGGLEGLKKAMTQNKPFLSFNFEQQASIIEHFYNLRNRCTDEEMNSHWFPYVHYWNELLSLKKAFSPNK